jgi:hypothetical protein
MRLTAVVLVTALGAGCARAVPVDSAADAAPATASANVELEPCPAPAPAEHGPWRMVRGAGFAFCVPTSWAPSAPPPDGGADRRSYRFADGEIFWSQSGVSRAGTMRIPAGLAPAQPTVQRTTETIGGQTAELSITEWPDVARLRTFARWTGGTSLYFNGQARTRDAAELELAVYRTVRFAK